MGRSLGIANQSGGGVADGREGPGLRRETRGENCGGGAETAEFDEAAKEMGKSSPDPLFFFSTSAFF